MTPGSVPPTERHSAPTSAASDLNDPVLIAGVDMLRRTGQRQFQIRYHDDEQPVVWIAVGMWVTGPAGMPVAGEGQQRYDAAAALDPTRAVLRLCEQVIDGGLCQHCHRPAGFDPDSIDTMPADDLVCWYQYAPELKTFRRGCEGDTR